MDVDISTHETPLTDPELTLLADARVIVNRKALTTDALTLFEPDAKEEASFSESDTNAHNCVLSRVPSFLLGLFPCVAWMRSYSVRSFLVADVLAGLSVAVLHVPQGLVCAIIAGVDPVLGLYSSLYPGLIYAVMGTSPYISIGAFPVTALMTGVVVQKYSVIADNATALADDGVQLSTEQSRNGVATTMAFMSGLIQVALWLLPLDRLAGIISPVMAEGFLTATAVMVIVSQLPSVFGGGAQTSKGLFGTPLTIYYVAKSIPHSVPATLLLSLAASGLLFVLKGVVAHQMRRITVVPLPADLILVIFATTASHFLELDVKHNVKVLGHIASGFPKPTPPPFENWLSLLPDATAIAVVQFVSTFLIAKLFSQEQRLKISANQEMLAYGMSNVVGSFFSCIPAGSALVRSLVLKEVGANTQVGGMVSCVLVALTLYSLAPIFRPLPECVLGVVIIVALLPTLTSLRNLPKLWVFNRFDFVLWSLSFLGVVILNATWGLLFGVLLGLVVIFLELSGNKGCRLKPCRPDIFVSVGTPLRTDAVTLYRFGSPLCFATQHNIVADFEELFKDEKPRTVKVASKLDNMEACSEAVATKVVVMDCSAISYIDSAGVQALDYVLDICKQNKCLLYLASLQDSTSRTIRTQQRLMEKIGVDYITPTMQDAIALSCSNMPARLFGSHLRSPL
ncbi:solute carrier family 26 member 6-like isoform X1 [Rhipicephalus microplus]|uniref:solute carrier family 26 member 6-like isoform X1 n=3 Tax=Rhipicephalus microplus TaxID=6941 RepID=UPI003F6B4C52